MIRMAVLLFLPLACSAQDSLMKGYPVMVLEGHYQNTNMYIQNPASPHAPGFCVVQGYW